jgi:tetrapyrrole methylase family protein/MazG family protein
VSRGKVIVVGLGPAGDDLVTVGTRAAIDRIGARYVRTTRHPSAGLVDGAESFDAVYETEPSIEAVYETIVERLAKAAEVHGEVLYAVPGSPVVAERTVELLLVDDRVEVEVLPALSFVDLAWSRLGIDPVGAGVRLVDGHRFEIDAAGERGPLLVAQCDSRQVLSDIKLAVDDEPPKSVVVLQRLGLPDETVLEVEWADLDRAGTPDHLTAVWIPRLAVPIAGEVARFAALVRTLRARCPWDREQTHQTLTRHLLEETYETLEAIEAVDEESGEGYEHLQEELGDLLFQVVFHATLAAEAGRFTLADVADGIHDKLVGRHPHVFGDTEAATAAAVMRNWEQIKAVEKGHESVMDGVSGSLPSLLYAHKVQRKAESLGVAPPPPEPPPADIGEALFALVAAARSAGVDPESALRAAAMRFRDEVKVHEAATARRP